MNLKIQVLQRNNLQQATENIYMENGPSCARRKCHKNAPTRGRKVEGRNAYFQSLPDDDKLVGAVLRPVSPQIDRVAKVVALGGELF